MQRSGGDMGVAREQNPGWHPVETRQHLGVLLGRALHKEAGNLSFKWGLGTGMKEVSQPTG